MSYTAPHRSSRRPARSTNPLRILLATSGDAESLGAVHLSALLARRAGATVEVLTVVPPFPHYAPVGFHVAPPAVIDEENREASLERVREQLGTVRGARQWRVDAVVGWPSDVIVDAARRWKASLIVVGIGHHGVWDRLIGSETAVTIAGAARVPLLAVPEDVARLPVNAAAAVDFTPSSVRAARLAANLLPPTGVITLVHTSMFVKATAEAGTLTDIYAEGAQDKLDKLAGEIDRASHRKVATVMTDGPVTESLMRVMEDRECDLLALGSHARGLIDRLLMGSVRTRMLRRAHFPVLIVPDVEEPAP